MACLQSYGACVKIALISCSLVSTQVANRGLLKKKFRIEFCMRAMSLKFVTTYKVICILEKLKNVS